jgi:predicted GNAT family acetyltransferase
MLDLATLTQPGPFTLRALDLGRFWGIRQDGRLVAMAGMRMAVPGLVELSGVCAHPDARGQGLARLLSRYVSARIEEGGDRPFLHAWAANTAAIALYRSIGFSIRTQMHVLAIRRLGTPPGPPGDAGEGGVH